MVQLYSRVSRSLALPISTMPKFIIPLADKLDSSIGGMTATFTRNSTATYVDDAGIEHTVGTNVPLFMNGRYLPQTFATNIFLQSGTPATQTITVVSGSKYTVSCYGSGSIALSGAGTGTVVQGTPVTFTAASTTLTCVPSSIDKAQVELGSKATSYIPTTSSPVTRVVDVLHYHVGDVITQGQGSLYCEFVIDSIIGGIRNVLVISDGTVNNRISIYLTDTGLLEVYGVLSGTGVIVIVPAIQVSTFNKVLLTYSNNKTTLYHNGIKRGEDILCNIPTVFTKLNVGCNIDSTRQLNDEVGNVKYFKEVITPAEAIKLTTL